ncbi:twin-arginine translocation signal domain-containing protein [bacterium]|nr:twin-arginine translocation signal domain-containing protein [bacterium]MBU1065014.1 twin-arginine translocation signal domain-containing protein [bacterium]MBU1634962.1 twin-arginine translocation signal domain-containing protein [bacterium]MBU1872782.1 twin-arginine translocation signal domain-containing protein [bacterium]
MKRNEKNEDTNITRRNFLKKLTMTAVFTVPTIQSFKLMAQGKSYWTGHGHGNHHSSSPIPPPPPPSSSP